MNSYTEKVGDKLNELLESTYDAENGFKKAADNIDEGSLKNYFERKAQERYDFGHAIKNQIRQFGQEVDKGDSIPGKAHRSWMDIKSLFSSDGEEAMLNEVQKGEKVAIEEYNYILRETNLPASTENLLKKQRDKIQNGLMEIKSLHDLA